MDARESGVSVVRNLAVVGSPIAHSKSPLIQSAAYRTLSLDWSYEKIEVQKNHLSQFVNSLDESWLGLSVTAPLKLEALRLAESIDSTSELTEATNTLVRTETGWRGFNTDVFGIQQSLRAAGVASAARVSVIGTGATARSAILAAVRNFPEFELILAGRNKSAARELIFFAKSLGVKRAAIKSVRKALTSADLVISALPAKVLDADARSLKKSRFSKPRGVFFDVAYDPWPSEAAKIWADEDLKIISGVEMLLWQAIAQVRIFSNGSPDVELFNEGAVLLAMRHSIGLI